MFWRKKKDPSPLTPPPVPPAAPPVLPDGLRQEIQRELEAIGGASGDDYLTAGIGMIKMGAKELLPGWLRSFGKADVFVVSVEEKNPEVAFCFGPGGSPDFVAVFTRLDLAQACMREMPKLKFAMRVTGLDLLEQAKAGRKGVWINVMNEACSVRFPANMIPALLEEARRQ